MYLSTRMNITSNISDKEIDKRISEHNDTSFKRTENDYTLISQYTKYIQG